MTVLNTLGAGFLEKIYQNALALEICAAGLQVVQQCGTKVYYRDQIVGEYSVDLMVEDLPLNFAKPRLEIKRVVLGL